MEVMDDQSLLNLCLLRNNFYGQYYNANETRNRTFFFCVLFWFNVARYAVIGSYAMDFVFRLRVYNVCVCNSRFYSLIYQNWFWQVGLRHFIFGSYTNDDTVQVYCDCRFNVIYESWLPGKVTSYWRHIQKHLVHSITGIPILN